MTNTHNVVVHDICANIALHGLKDGIFAHATTGVVLPVDVQSARDFLLRYTRTDLVDYAKAAIEKAVLETMEIKDRYIKHFKKDDNNDVGDLYVTISLLTGSIWCRVNIHGYDPLLKDGVIEQCISPFYLQLNREGTIVDVSDRPFSLSGLGTVLQVEIPRVL